MSEVPTPSLDERKPDWIRSLEDGFRDPKTIVGGLALVTMGIPGIIPDVVVNLDSGRFPGRYDGGDLRMWSLALGLAILDLSMKSYMDSDE